MHKSMASDQELSNISLRLMHDSMLAARIDPGRAFAAARVDRSVIEDPAGKVPMRTEKAMQSAFARLNAGVPNLFADVGARFTAGLFDVAGLALMTVPTIRRWAAFIGVADFHFSLAEFSLVELDSSCSTLQLTVPSGTEPALAQLTFERDVAALLVFLDDIWQSEFPMLRIELSLPVVPGRIRSLSHCPVTGGSTVTRLAWRSDVNDHPLPRGNDHAFRYYAGRTQALYGSTANAHLNESAVEQVVKLLHHPGNARLSLDEVAHQLWMAPRTLQRHLADSGVAFRTLREMARAREARRLLVETNLPITDIASRLGYSEMSSMSAAFRRWEKEAPSDYRRRERTQAAPAGPAV
jgi:AraC-like DNA-binding protein